MHSISLCMITKNEERFLKQCLDSIKDIVDEIIIVDTGSTDKTKEVAAKFTNKIYDFKWCNDFSAARNESLKYAKGDWILVLDADETIAERDHSKIKKAINFTEIVGFSLIQRNYMDESRETGWISSKDDDYIESKIAAGWVPAKPVRLFKNNKNIFYEGLVHESVNNSLIKLGKIAHLDIPIHHYGKLNQDKVNKKGVLYEKIGKDKIKREKDFYSYFELAKQYVANRKLTEAVHNLEKSIELKQDYFESWYLLGSIYLLINDLDNALSKLKRAQALNHAFAPIYANLGVIYAKKKEFKKAVKNFIKALKLNPKDATAYKNLGMCFDELGNKQKAYSCFKKAIELDPKYKEKIKL
ncbi:tetratricopeptide repeat protein [Candidatus Woesearchaeota archaeon]|nr:tetratricopeptide repeat protein [Candidatus Woesearchaeota archaeon]